MINVVYMIVRIIQFLLFLGTFGLIYKIYRAKNTRKQRILLVASICAALNMYGYLEALSTMSEQSSKWAVRSQYVSAVLYLVFMLHLIELLCDFGIKNKIQSYILWSLNAILSCCCLWMRDSRSCSGIIRLRTSCLRYRSILTVHRSDMHIWRISCVWSR